MTEEDADEIVRTIREMRIEFREIRQQLENAEVGSSVRSTQMAKAMVSKFENANLENRTVLFEQWLDQGEVTDR